MKVIRKKTKNELNIHSKHLVSISQNVGPNENYTFQCLCLYIIIQVCKGEKQSVCLLALPTKASIPLCLDSLYRVYSSLRDFYRPLGAYLIGLFLYEDF
jgi:hypothetical protein